MVCLVAVCRSNGRRQGATAYLQAREEGEAEQFELAIRRIQARRREKREERERQKQSVRSQRTVVVGVPPSGGPPSNNQSRYVVFGATLPLVEEVPALATEDEANVSDGSQEDGHDCIICLDSLTNGEGVESLLCGHVFHTPCISTWFDEGGQGRLCPLCRHPS